jgi:hypothetical protein
MVSVIAVEAGSGASGAITTFWLPFEKLIVPGTEVIPPPDTWIVVPPMVTGSIAPLNATLIFAFNGTFVSLSAGPTASTVGAEVWIVPPVVKQ